MKINLPPGVRLSPKVALRDGAFGASVFAAARIGAGEPLVRAPRALTLSGDSVLPRAGGDAALEVALRRLLAGGQTSEAISLFLARQRRRPGGALQLWVESMPHAVANVDKGGAVITPLR